MNFSKRRFRGFCWDYLWLLAVHFSITERNNLMGSNNTLQEEKS